jgi:hypothetical protein
MSANNRYLQQIEKTLRKDVQVMDGDELLYMYGIQLDDSGAVYDTVNELTYQSINNWIDVYLDDSREDKELIGASYEWDE